tara:strand:- start:551 stop:733 length:183 start_codon:yes stop_codon:yes gene_type:complete
MHLKKKRNRQREGKDGERERERKRERGTEKNLNGGVKGNIRNRFPHTTFFFFCVLILWEG